MNWNKHFKYNPETGQVLRKFKTTKARIGAEAGTINSVGYKVINFNYKLYLTHRIVWEMHNGTIPPKLCVDHIDGNPLNNKLNNLRIVTKAENLRNQKRKKTNTSGITGVRWNPINKNYRASIKFNYKDINLGSYLKLEDAARARKEAEAKYGFHQNHGRIK